MPCEVMSFGIFINILLFFPINIQGASIAVSDAAALEGTGKFWQLTDIHWDFRYSIDGNPEKMCHSAPQVSPMGTSIKGNGQFGDYLCDAPWLLVRAGLDAMVKIEEKPDFILWTGDIGPHVHDPRPSFDVIFRALKNVTAELLGRFPAPVAILPVLGNHDAFPQDDFPNCPSSFFERYLTEGGWSTVLTAEQQDSFKRGGFYSYDAPASVKVVVLNTNMYYFGNELGTSDPDPCGQFSWLLTELDRAQQQDYKVMLVGHAPPGFFERFPIIPSFNFSYNEHYLDLVEYKAALIHSHVYGHLHTDSFRVYGSLDAGTSSVAFMAPSLTPWQANITFGGTAINPSLRLYTYDNVSVLDYAQYHLNLTRANGQRDQDKYSVTQGTALASTERTGSHLDLAPVEGNEERVPLGGASKLLHKMVGDQGKVSGAEGDPDFGPWEEKKIEITSEDSSVSEKVEYVTQVDMIESTTVVDFDETTHHWLGSRDLKKLDELIEDPVQPHIELFKNHVGESPLGVPEVPDLAHLEWELYYGAREAYSLDRLDSQNMNKLYSSLRDDEDVFDRYYERNSAGFSYHDGPCRGHCRHQQICAIKNSRVKDLFHCMVFNRTYIESLLAKTFNRLNVSMFDGYFDSEAAPTTEQHVEPSLPEEPSSTGNRLDICSPKSSLSGLCFGLSTLTVMTGFVFFWLFLGVFCSFKWRSRSLGRGVTARSGAASHGYRPLASDER